ncbi:sigma 54-interacting transcriptional regulator [bacterium]|nr:sigma 54-interacting transcriptional regulator [bacterium]
MCPAGIGFDSLRTENGFRDDLAMSNPFYPVRVLLVDDQPEVLWPLINFLEKEGYLVHMAERAKDALKMLPKLSPQIVFLDVKMPEMSGLEALEKIRSEYPDIITFIMTGNECIKDAVQAIKTGAFDYFTKPYQLEEIKFSMLRAMEGKMLKEEVAMLRKRLEERFDFSSIITADPKMFDIFDRLRKVASSGLSVLITGEHGTGKELIAQAIHYNSERKEGPFVPMDCAAIPESLFESEIFGHEKGAFTGSINKKKGFFVRAHRGTLFLDEIGNLRPENQTKLLRALQERKIHLLGGEEYIDVDLRLISATNIDLDAAKESGTFRDDLYYRIKQYHINIPPLRERPNDILLIARHFLVEEAKKKAKGGGLVKELSPEAMEILMEYSWPGNVRELKNVIESASVIAEEKILPEHLTLPIVSKKTYMDVGIQFSVRIPSGCPLKEMRKRIIDQAERFYIERTLMESNYQKGQVCKRLKIGTRLLSQKMEQYRIVPESFKFDPGKGCDAITIESGMTFKSLRSKIGHEIERTLIIKALCDANGNKAKAARLYGIDYKTIHSKIREFKITQKDIASARIPDSIMDIPLTDTACQFKELFGKIRQKMEESLIMAILRQTNWDKAKAARSLDIDYKTLYNKLHKYCLMEKV